MMIFETLDISSYSKTSHFVSPHQEHPSVRLALKMMCCFNRAICIAKAENSSQVNQFQDTIHSYNKNLSKIFRNIGKIFSCCCILWKYYHPRFETILLETVNIICSNSEYSNVKDGYLRSSNSNMPYGQDGMINSFQNLGGNSIEAIANKTIMFCQDIIHNSMLYSKERGEIESKGVPLCLIQQKANSNIEVEPRLNIIIPSDLRRSSSDDHLLSRDSISKEKLVDEVTKEFEEFNINTSPAPKENGGLSSTKEIVQLGIYEQNKLYYLLHPDEWAKLVINNWRISRSSFEDSKDIINDDSKDQTKFDTLKNSLIKELNDFLSSYLPKIKDDCLYSGIIHIIKSLDESIISEKLKENICVFVIHQFRYNYEETNRLRVDLDLQVSEKEYMECIYKPFSSKMLKDEYEYLIIKLKDYSSYTVSDRTFEDKYLGDETVRKEFINRCFFSNIEKLLGKLDEIKSNRDLFFLIIMKILPMMSEKQQKNLNKVMLKNCDKEIPEGLKLFLKKQIKKLKEQEFELLQDNCKKLEQMMNQYNEKFSTEPSFKIPVEKAKEFCNLLDTVISIVRSNQKYCSDIGGSMQGWVYSEYNWVLMLLKFPKYTKFPKANQEQIKRCYKHAKDICNKTEMKTRIVQAFGKFIEAWGLSEKSEWTNLLVI